MLRLVAAILIALALSGCATTGMAPSTPAPPAPSAAPEAPNPQANPTRAPLVGPHGTPRFSQARLALACGCYEPSIAVDAAGRILAMENGGQLAVSTDEGATFQPIPPAPLPAGALPGAGRGDAMLQTGPDGRVYLVGLVSRAGVQGVEVAWTQDGGQTWPTNTLLSPSSASTPSLVMALADRPWLGFGPDGAVYMTYSNLPTGIWMAHSSDGGQTFSPLVLAAPSAEGLHLGEAGPPVVLPDGHVLFPVYTLATPDADTSPSLLAFVTADGGTTFSQQVALHPVSARDFPIASLDGHGNVVIAIAGVDQAALVVSSSDDGQSWSKPTPWSADGEKGSGSAWPLAGAKGLDVLYYTQANTLLLARGDATGGPQQRLVAAPAFASTGGSCACNTDFAHLAHLADGRAVATWIDTTGVMVAVEAAPS